MWYCLVGVGFEYTKDEENNFIFERSFKFDSGWRTLPYVRSLYCKN